MVELYLVTVFNRKLLSAVQLYKCATVQLSEPCHMSKSVRFQTLPAANGQVTSCPLTVKLSTVPLSTVNYQLSENVHEPGGEELTG
jgi:hypothetical protein